MASFTIHILAEPEESLEWPEGRPATYDPDLIWGWDGEKYAWVTGGGRYKNRIVAVGHEVVYFGDI